MRLWAWGPLEAPARSHGFRMLSRRAVRNLASMPESQDMDEELRPALQLAAISVRGFRCLENVVDVGVTDELTVLTGQNDGGKTAMLDAIAFLLAGGFTPSDSDRTHTLDEDAPIEVSGRFVARGREEWVKVRALRSSDGTVKRQIRDRVHREFEALPSSMNIQPLRDRIGELDIPYERLDRKDAVVAAVEKWIATRPADEFDTVWRDLTQEEDERLPRMHRFASVSVSDPRSDIEMVVRRRVHDQLAAASYPELAEIGGDLTDAVNEHLEDLKRRIVEHVPEFDEISVVPRIDFNKPSVSVEVVVHRGGETIQLEREGEGVRRRIALALYEDELALLEDMPESLATFVTYDEPDVHLDYASQRELFDTLNRQAELARVQVMVATHSRNFIDRAPLVGVLHLKLNDDRRTKVEVLEASENPEERAFLESIATGLGLRHSVLLDEGCFLVVEGDTEKTAVPELFRVATGRSFAASGVTVLNTEGSGSVRRLVRVIAEEWKRDMVVLLDEDAREELDTGWLAALDLDEDQDVFFVGDKEFEDAFTDDQWASALNAYSPKDEGWESQDVATLRGSDKFSEELVNLVRRTVRDASVGKPDLGAALAQTVKPDGVPASLRRCLEAVHEQAMQRPGRAT